MRNPNRTTKPERRAARRHCPTICRAVGTATAARLRRQGLTDDATALDRLALALDMPPWLFGESSTGMHWTDYQDYAKTEDGRVVYVDPAVYEQQSRALMDQMRPIFQERIEADLAAAGLDGSDYTIEYDYRDLFTKAVVMNQFHGLEPVTEVAADSPDLPEVFRTAVEAFVGGQGGNPADYTVAYRASQLETDSAEILILPKWEHGGVLEDYQRAYGHGTPIQLHTFGSEAEARQSMAEAREHAQGGTWQIPESMFLDSGPLVGPGQGFVDLGWKGDGPCTSSP